MILFSIILSIVGIHCLYVLLAIFGWIRVNKIKSESSGTEITVIIPFRNEVNGINLLLDQLSKLQLPKEIILVNDHSDDGTVEKIEAFLKIQPNSKILLVQSNGVGKKEASATGIQIAKGDRIVFTDADCKINDEVIRSHNTATAFTYGPVIHDEKFTGIKSIFLIDQLAMNALSVGCGKIGLHLFCSGANMSGATTELQSASGKLLHSKNLSGDDTDLLNYFIVHQKPIAVLSAKESLVYTKGPSTFAQFLHQRLRWGQKAIYFRQWPLILLSLMTFLFPIGFFCTIINCISGHWPWSWALVYGAGLCIDLLFLFLVSTRLGVAKHLLFFIPWWIFSLFYIPLIGITGLIYSGNWKGRKIKR